MLGKMADGRRQRLQVQEWKVEGNERYAEADSGGGGDPEQRREPVMTVVLTP